MLLLEDSGAGTGSLGVHSREACRQCNATVHRQVGNTQEMMQQQQDLLLRAVLVLQGAGSCIDSALDYGTHVVPGGSSSYFLQQHTIY
jgi:precorrin-6B methylase 2